MRCLITGAAGFVGHHLVDHILKNTDWHVTVLDRVDEAGNMNRLSEMESWRKNTKRTQFIWHDLRAEINTQLAHQIGDVDYIFHIAAASHVDRSIADPLSFVMDNVVGTCNILNYARNDQTYANLKKFFYFSTDEVFGSTDTNVKYKEWDRYKSGNPYSATKAGGEELALAYHNTYKVPVIITHCMNVFGERQHPEKFIPKIIKHVLAGETVPIYSDEKGLVSGSRNYIYADDVSRALLMLVDKGTLGEKYNIEGGTEMSNLEVARMVAGFTGKEFRMEMIPSSQVRPGNDFAYGIDGRKLRSMGFKIEDNFEKRIKSVVKWYMSNRKWL